MSETKIPTAWRPHCVNQVLLRLQEPTQLLSSDLERSSAEECCNAFWSTVTPVVLGAKPHELSQRLTGAQRPPAPFLLPKCPPHPTCVWRTRYSERHTGSSDQREVVRAGLTLPRRSCSLHHTLTCCLLPQWCLQASMRGYGKTVPVRRCGVEDVTSLDVLISIGLYS